MLVAIPRMTESASKTLSHHVQSTAINTFWRAPYSLLRFLNLSSMFFLKSNEMKVDWLILSMTVPRRKMQLFHFYGMSWSQDWVLSSLWKRNATLALPNHYYAGRSSHIASSVCWQGEVHLGQQQRHLTAEYIHCYLASKARIYCFTKHLLFLTFVRCC